MSSASEKLGDLAQSAGVIFIGTIVGRALGLLGETLIVRSLSPATFGEVSLAYTIVFAAGSVLIFGVHDGTTRLFSARSESDQMDIIKAGVLLSLVIGTAGALAIYLARGHIARSLGFARISTLLVPLSVFVLLYPVSRVLFGVLRGLGMSNAGIYAKNLFPRVIALLGFFAATSLTTGVNAAVVYWGILPAVTILVAGGYLAKHFETRHLVTHVPSGQTVRDLWSFSWPLAIGSIVFLFLSQLDILMLGYLSDSRSVGLYRSIQPLKQVATFIMGSFSFLFLPVATEFYEQNKLDELDELYTVSTKWISALTFPMVLVFTLFAESVSTAFFGAEYAAAAPALSILVGGLMFRALVGLNGDLVRAIEKPRIEALTAVPGLVVNAVLNLLLIPRYGIIGAATATVAGYVVYNTGEVAAVFHYTGSHPFSLRLFRQLLPTATVAVGCALLFQSYTISLPGLIGLGMLFAGTQVASTVLTRSIDPADLLLLERVESASGRTFPRARELLQQYSE